MKKTTLRILSFMIAVLMTAEIGSVFVSANTGNADAGSVAMPVAESTSENMIF